MINYVHPDRVKPAGDGGTGRINYVHPRRAKTTPATAATRGTVRLRAGESVTLTAG